MLKIFAKLIGFIALAMTVITAILDLTRSIADSTLKFKVLGEAWSEFHVPSLQYLQVGIERHLGLPWIWENIAQNILLAPSWLVFGVLAIIFLWMGRRKERRWRHRFGS